MPAPVKEGDVVASKYLVQRVLGEGGMGVVVAARHLALDEQVALKFLSSGFAEHPEAAQRFAREARATVRVKSEHVARVIDVGELASGVPFIVLEYLDGEDLSALLSRVGPLPLGEAVDYVVQTCEAMAEAHTQGVIHRDLKPSNLMLVRRTDGTPCIKVLDFGISKMASAQPEMSLTRTTAVLGSPLYMSPEQLMQSKFVDERSDVWSLGVILYELLAGRVPFLAETHAELAVRIATEQPPPLRTFRRDIVEGLERVASRCLSKNREDRFSDVAELARALAPFALERSIASIERSSRILRSASGPQGRAPDGRADPIDATGTRQSAIAVQSADATQGAIVAHSSTPQPSEERRSPVVVVLAGTTLAALVAVGFVATRGTSRRQELPAAESPATTNLGTPPPNVAAAPAPPAPPPTAAEPSASSAAAPPSSRVLPLGRPVAEPGVSRQRAREAGAAVTAAPTPAAAKPTTKPKSSYEDF